MTLIEQYLYKSLIMNTFTKSLILSVSAALISVSASAAPQGHPSEQHHQVQHSTQSTTHHQHGQTQKKSVHPSHDWKAGQKVPAQYRGQGYKVDHSKYRKLSKPGHQQQWIKVNGDYVLTSTLTHTIIRIIAG